tara:strand:- start:12 stop:239 length:228 start_codon:yes stop_codon:yes gene_type:complete
MNTAQYKDERGLYNMTKEQVRSADYSELNAICCSCNAQGGWTVGTKDLVILELARRQREMIRGSVGTPWAPKADA